MLLDSESLQPLENPLLPYGAASCERKRSRAEIAETIQEILEPQGVGVVIEAEHSCMTLRGVNTLGSTLTTSRLLGVIRDDARTREEFLGMVRGG